MILTGGGELLDGVSMTNDEASGARSPTARIGLLAAGLHLAALGAFAFAQPLFDVLTRDPAFFVARGSTRADVIVLALAVTLGIPLALVIVLALAGLVGTSLRRVLHAGLVTALVALVAMPLWTRTLPAPGEAVLPAAVVTGLLGCGLYLAWAPLRTLLSILALAPLLFAATFVFDDAIVRITGDSAVEVAEIEGPASEAPVVFVMLDEFPLSSLLGPSLTIDRSRFPNFARLADDATWFRNATTNHDFTTHAVPALLTGRMPRDDERLPIAADHPHNLFTWLGASHRLIVHETVTEMCPPALLGEGRARASFARRVASLAADLPIVYAHIVLPQVYVRRLPPVTGAWEGFAADGEGAATGAGRGNLVGDLNAGPPQGGDPDGGDDEDPGAMRLRRAAEVHKDRTAVFDAFVDTLGATAAGGPPTLHYHHAVLPHEPWVLLPDGVRYPASREVVGQWAGTWEADEWPTRVGLQRHLLQVGALDRLLGRLFARLDAIGSYDRTAIVITADHGISFDPGGPWREATSENADDIARVPLLIKAPGQRTGRVDDRNVEAVDVLPTLAEALGVSLPWEVDGRSAWSEDATPRAYKSLHRREGPSLSLDGKLPARWPAVRRSQEIFGPGDGWEPVLGLGDDFGLRGRSLSEWTVGEGAAQAQLLGAERFADVVTAAGVLPCFVQGHVTAQRWQDVPDHVAIAVGGTIGAVTRVFERTPGRGRFMVVLSPSLFKDGHNAVELLSVSTDTMGDVTLARLAARSFGLRVTGDRLSLVRPDGRTLDVAAPAAPGRLEGLVNQAVIEHDVLRIVGWAVDPDASQDVDAVLVFEGERCVYTGTTGMPMAQLEASRGAAFADSGFHYRLSLDLFDGELDDAVRIIALRANMARELTLGPRARWLHP